MKCAIVITLVLAILYCLFNIGDALSKQARAATIVKINFLNENVPKFSTILNYTMEYVNKTRATEKMTLKTIRENALTEIEVHATDTGKTENEVAKKCIKAARVKLKTASNHFFSQINKNFRFRREHRPRVAEYESIIKEGNALLTIFNGILSNIPTTHKERIKTKYKTLRVKVNRLTRKMAQPRGPESMVSEYSILVEAERKILLKKVESIKEKAKKCIDEA